MNLEDELLTPPLPAEDFIKPSTSPPRRHVRGGGHATSSLTTAEQAAAHHFAAVLSRPSRSKKKKKKKAAPPSSPPRPKSPESYRVIETGKEYTGRWTKEEHDDFLAGLKIHGKDWKKVAARVKTRTVVQIRTHAQKYLQKLQKITKVRGILFARVFTLASCSERLPLARLI